MLTEILISLHILSTAASSFAGCTASDKRLVLKELDATIEQVEHFEQLREAKIDSIRTLATSGFVLAANLFEQYNDFQLDTAFRYAFVMQELATTRQEKLKAGAALVHCYGLMSYFKEACDIINEVEAYEIGEDEEMLALCEEAARLYENLGAYVYSTPPTRGRYTSKMHEYVLKAYQLAPEGSARKEINRINLLASRGASNEELISLRLELLSKYPISDHEKAVQYSRIANSCMDLGDRDGSICYRALSTICDIRSATRETTSAKTLAEQMYDEGDLKPASRYVKLALRDVQMGNFNLRKIETNHILHQIEEKQYILKSNQNLIFIVLISVFLLLLTLLMYLSLRLHQKRNQIMKINEELAKKNEMLHAADKAKEAYLVELIRKNSYSSFIDTLYDTLQKTITHIVKGRTEKAKDTLYGIGLADARNDSLKMYDDAFMSLFPDFLDKFNALFPAGEGYHLDKNGYLPMEVRIYALFRLGIDNSAEIARCLNLNVNTVYVYRSKVKAHAIVARESFDDIVRRL